MNNKISLFIGISILIFLLGVGVSLIWWFTLLMKEIDTTVGAALIAAVATVISSVFIASYNSRKAKERIAFEAHREKKAEIYNEFMDVLKKIMQNTKSGKKADEALPDNLEEFFQNFTTKIMIYGGAGVIKAYSNFRSSSKEKPAEKDSLYFTDVLFREIRNDLGESNKGIGDLELIGLYIIGGKDEIDRYRKK